MPSSTPERDASGAKQYIPAPRVFWPVTIILVTLVAWALLAADGMQSQLTNANTFIVKQLGWYYVATVTGFVFFAAALAISPLGRVVLGKDDDEPDFSLPAWFAMLFAAGMGIGLVFYGVAEPLMHFMSPPPGVGEGDRAHATAAMDATFLHWGFHAWSIYVVAGLSLAFAVHRKGHPVSIRWALYPLLGDRIKGVWGDVIDVVAVIGTVVGVATSLGFGVSQVASGLEYLGVVGEVSKVLLMVLIAVITGFAVISVSTGLDKGIRVLSNANMVLAAVFVALILAVGPTFFILDEFIQQIGSYLQKFFGLSFRTYAYAGEPGKDWLSGWTTYYWGWWMSWAPFVGVFIARISRGRTVREFILGVVLVPTLLTFFWFSVMGGTGIWTQINRGGLADDKGTVDSTMALFQTLDQFNISTLLAIMAIVLVTVFFVTSSDSGSFVVDMLSSGGDPNPPVVTRVYWGIMEGVIAAVLLGFTSAGLGALQMLAILTAAPFSIVMILMAISVVKGLREDHEIIKKAERKLLAKQVAQEIAEHHTP